MPGVLDIIQPMIIAYVHCRTQMFHKGGSKFLSNRISNSCKLKIMSSITVNPFQKVTTSCWLHMSKMTLTLGQGRKYSFYKESGCIKTINILKIELRIQYGIFEIFDPIVRLVRRAIGCQLIKGVVDYDDSPRLGMC